MQIMNERGQSIYEYVVAAEVLQTLGSTGLSQAECHIARKAVEHDRAQWVVDSIALELDSRRQALADRKLTLTSELELIDEDLAIIDKIREPKKEQNITAELIELYDAKVEYRTFKDIAKDQPPFGLKMQYDKHRSDMLKRPAYSVHKWAESNRTALQQMYGKRITASIFRSAHAIDRNFSWEDHNDYPAMQEAVIQRELGDNAELVVNDPSMFFGYLFDGRDHFSHKTLVATLCLAEFQKTYDSLT